MVYYLRKKWWEKNKIYGDGGRDGVDTQNRVHKITKKTDTALHKIGMRVQMVETKKTKKLEKNKKNGKTKKYERKYNRINLPRTPR